MKADQVSKSCLLFMMMAGCLMGMACRHASMLLSAVYGILTALVCATLGFTVCHAEREEDRRVARAGCLARIADRPKMYRDVIRMCSDGIARMVALRLIKEMFPHLDNEEQRSAAMDRAETIVREEVDRFMDKLDRGER